MAGQPIRENDEARGRGLWARVAWSDGPGREAGEGVVIELLDPTRADGQLRYRIAVFLDGKQTAEEIVLPHGVVYPVPRWRVHMDREERLRYHRGSTLPWNEPIPGE
ncbi:hypothetical protein [Longimicrobium sp.]|uniref:hypothetical protein n=1 Tax=Longimicrobium sp. TaxID=2029185 RepID=UPI002E2FA8B2|nr:hypothetical protein [Longimicrobium sp.]HEX6037269.1 hypothetical protein [Longimicrobium sp.]